MVDSVRRGAFFAVAALFGPQATVAALVSASSGAPCNFEALLTDSPESVALSDGNLSECRARRLLPDELLARVAAYYLSLRRTKESMRALDAEEDMPAAAQWYDLLLHRALGPNRGEPDNLALGNEFTELMVAALPLRQVVDAHARAVCKSLAREAEYSRLLDEWDTMVSLPSPTQPMNRPH
jgi:hypothetical protein